MEETKEEYPDEKQRVAVAYSYWNKAKGIKDSSLVIEEYDTDDMRIAYRWNKDEGYEVYMIGRGDTTPIKQRKNLTKWQAENIVIYTILRNLFDHNAAQNVKPENGCKI